MTDSPKWFQPGYRFPERQAKPGELLFEFVRASDRAPMSCELRFHGESYGWEAQFLERGELFFGSGAFVTKAAAVRWAGRCARPWRARASANRSRRCPSQDSGASLPAMSKGARLDL
jgi:hypothetical protein